MLGRQPLLEPLPGQSGDLVERSRFLEEMGRPDHRGLPVAAPEVRGGFLVEFEHLVVGGSHDEQGRTTHGREPDAGEIGPPPS